MPRACCAATSSRRACRCWWCPARSSVKRAAEAEGLDRVFLDAGAEWRESGCSMCLGMNGDLVPAGQYSVSTSNRNFEGRQGVGARTLARQPRDRRRFRHPRPGHRPARIPVQLIDMAAVKTIRSRTVVLPATNIDTDQIIPARFLTSTSTRGLRQEPVRRLALRRRRQSEAGFRAQPARGRRVRTSWSPAATSAAAPRASTRPGRCRISAFAAVISTEFADIFRTNCLKNGLVPVLVDESTHAWLLANPGAEVSIDVESTTLTLPDGTRRQVSARRLRALLPAERHRRARLPAGTGRRHLGVRTARS